MADTTEARRLSNELAADVAALLREGLPQEALRAEAAQGMLRNMGDAIESRDATIAELRAEVAVLQMACSRWERALEHGADRIRNAENERDSLRAQVEALRADAERLDQLEAMANMPGGILLHDGSEHGRTGLGLRPGMLIRTLRDAIDAARSQEATR